MHDRSGEELEVSGTVIIITKGSVVKGAKTYWSCSSTYCGWCRPSRQLLICVGSFLGLDMREDFFFFRPKTKAVSDGRDPAFCVGRACATCARGASRFRSRDGVACWLGPRGFTGRSTSGLQHIAEALTEVALAFRIIMAQKIKSKEGLEQSCLIVPGP